MRMYFEEKLERKILLFVLYIGDSSSLDRCFDEYEYNLRRVPDIDFFLIHEKI